MYEQSREILPVAPTDVERRIHNNQEILEAISLSLDNPDGMSESSRVELAIEKDSIRRHMSDLATRLTVQQQYAA